MISRVLDNLLGRGDAAVTIPTLDGALRPNRTLDEAETRIPVAGVDSLVSRPDGLWVSAGSKLCVLSDDTCERAQEFDADIAALAPVGTNGLAVALSDGTLHLIGGAHSGKLFGPFANLSCITAIAADEDKVYIANGSADVAASDWTRDLLQGGASGSLHQVDLISGEIAQLCDGLAYPSGLVRDGDHLVLAEAWRHRLLRLDPKQPQDRRVVCSDLAGYPGRLAAMGDGFLLSVFAPRSQLVEFVLRERSYRNRMINTVPEAYWIAPKLRSGHDFYEPLQGGSVKQLGRLKPWAPTFSAGLCVRLDGGLQPVESLHSRADGQTHGITSAVEHKGQTYVAARGNGVVVAARFQTQKGTS
jgi:hypothetical protein